MRQTMQLASVLVGLMLFASVLAPVLPLVMAANPHIEGHFLGLVIDDLKSSTNPDHDAWLQVTGRNQTINEALHRFVFSGMSKEMEDADGSLRLLGRVCLP